MQEKKSSGSDAESPDQAGQFQERLAQLRLPEPHPSRHIGARLRNYFLTGLVIVGPVTITVYIVWWFINVVDAWVKPILPKEYNPETYLPFEIPGIGLFIAIAGLTLIGALAANLLGRTFISFGELMLERMPIVRNVYRALKQLFESILSAANTAGSFQKVGLIEFPSKGIWALVFVTAETGGEIKAVQPSESELVTVFVPTAIVPPTGFISFVPRKDVIFLDMSAEDAAKVILSAGLVVPEFQNKLALMAEKAQEARAASAAKDQEPASDPK